MTYAPFGPLTGLTYGNGLVLAKTYTQDYRINALTVQDPSTLAYVLNRTHAFSDGINLTGITDSRTAPGGAPSAAANGYSYPSTNNKLASIAQGATTVRSFSYDGAGNITADTRGATTYNYRYNKRNRLDQLTIGSTVTANYTYDGLERLAIRTTQNMSPAGTTHYLYDLAGHLLAEADTTGQTLREYVWLDDMPLAVESDVNTGSPNLYFVHADHLDTPLRMTDASKAVVWDAYFLPFGTVQSITGSASNNLRFPGQYFLIEDGLHYNWYRHYDPAIGRYTEPDPLGLASGPNVYAYANLSPTITIDPDGQQDGTTIWRHRGFTPIPPDVFSEWKKYAERGMTGLWNFCRRVISKTSGGGEDEDDECHSRYNEEVQRCYKSKWQVAHPDYTPACVTRASIRRDLCIRNGGTPDPNEPPEWKPGPNYDEDTWRNFNR